MNWDSFQRVPPTPNQYDVFYDGFGARPSTTTTIPTDNHQHHIIETSAQPRHRQESGTEGGGENAKEEEGRRRFNLTSVRSGFLSYENKTFSRREEVNEGCGRWPSTSMYPKECSKGTSMSYNDASSHSSFSGANERACDNGANSSSHHLSHTDRTRFEGGQGVGGSEKDKAGEASVIHSSIHSVLASSTNASFSLPHYRPNNASTQDLPQAPSKSMQQPHHRLGHLAYNYHHHHHHPHHHHHHQQQHQQHHHPSGYTLTGGYASALQNAYWNQAHHDESYPNVTQTLSGPEGNKPLLESDDSTLAKQAGDGHGGGFPFRNSFHSLYSEKDMVTSDASANSGGSLPPSNLSPHGLSPSSVLGGFPWPGPRRPRQDEEKEEREEGSEEEGMLIQEGRPLPPFLPPHEPGRAGAQEGAKGEREDRDNRGELAQALASGFGITKGRHEENESGMKKKEMSAPSSSLHTPCMRPTLASDPLLAQNRRWKRRRGSPGMETEKADSVTSSCSFSSEESSSTSFSETEDENEGEEEDDEDEDEDEAGDEDGWKRMDAKMASHNHHHRQRRLKELAMELLRARKRWGKNIKKRNKKTKKTTKPRKRSLSSTFMAADNHPAPFRVGKAGNGVQEEHVDDEVDPVLTPKGRDRVLPSNSSSIPEKAIRKTEECKRGRSKKRRKIERMERIASDLLLQLNWEDAERGARHEAAYCNVKSGERESRTNNEHHDEDDVDDNKTMGNGGASERRRPTEALPHRSLAQVEATSLLQRDEKKEGSKFPCCCNTSARGQKSTKTCEHEYFGLTGNSKAIHGEQGMTTTSKTTLTATSAATLTTTTTISSTTNVPSATQPTSTTRTAEGKGDNSGGRKENITPNRSSASFFSQLHVRDTAERASDHYLSEKTFESSRYWPQVKNQVSSQDVSRVNLATSDLTPQHNAPFVNNHGQSLRERGCTSQTTGKTMEFTVFHHPQASPIISTVHAASASNSCDYINFGPVQASLADPAHSSSTTNTTALFQHQPQHTPLFAHQGPSGSTNQIDLQYPPQTQAPHVPIMFQPNLCVIQSGVSPGQCSTDSGYYGGAVTPQQQFYSTDIILNNANLSSVPMNSQTNSPTTSLPEDPTSLDETGSQASSSLPNGELHHFADSSWTPPMDCNNDPNRESRLYASSQSCDFLPPNSRTATVTGGNRFDESSCHKGTSGTGTTHCEDHVPSSPGSSVLGSSPDDDLSQLVDQVLDSIEEESSSLSSRSPSLAPGSSSSSATSCFNCGSILLTSGSCPLCSNGGFTTGNGDQGRTSQMPEEPEDNMDTNQEGLVINKGELLLQHQPQQHTHHDPPLVHHVNPTASTIAGHSQSSTISSSSSHLTQRKPKRSIGVVEPRVVVKLRVPNKDEQDKDFKKAGHSLGSRTTTMTAKKAAKNKSIVSGQWPNHSSMSDGSEDVEHEHHSSGLTSGKSRKWERRPLRDNIHRKRGHNETGEDDDDHEDDHADAQEQKASSASSRLELELGPNQIRRAKKPRTAPSIHLEDNHQQLVLNRLSITKTLPEHFKRVLERRREGSVFEPNEKPSSSKTPNTTRNCQVRLQKLDVCQYDDEYESDRHLQHHQQQQQQQQQQQRSSSRSSNETSSGDEDSDDSEKSAFIQHSQSLPTFSDLAAAFQECNQKESRRKRVSKGTTGNISALTIATRSEKEGRESECGHDGTVPMSSRVTQRPASSRLQSSPPVRGGRSKSSERDRSAIAISGSDTRKKSTETRRVWEDKENARNNPNYYATHLPSQKVDEANNIEASPDKPTKAIKIPPTFCQLSLENVVFTKRAPKVSSSQRLEASNVSLTNVADSSCSTDTNASSPRKTWPALPGRKKRTQGSSLGTKRNEKGAQGPTEQDKQEKVHVEEKMPQQHVRVPESQDMSSGHILATVSAQSESGTMKYVPNSTAVGKHVTLNQDYETLFSPIEPLQGHHEDLTSSSMSLTDNGKSREASNLLDMPLLDELGQSHMSDWHDFVSNPQHQNSSPSSSPDNHQTEGTQSRNDGYLKAVSPHKILSDTTRGPSGGSCQIITPTPDGTDKVNVFSSQALLKRRREARTVSKSDMATQAVEEDISSTPADQESTVDTIKNASRPAVIPTMPKETRVPKKKTRPQFTFAKEPQSQWMYCDIESCNFWTRKPERMKRHKLCHTSGHHKNFECPDCGLRFYSLPKMLKHDRKKHTGIKDYECRLCGAEVSDIGVHMRVHFEPNSHPCKICALKFKHRNSLVRHMCQHTGEQFRCGRCEAVYVTLEELNQHIRQEHPHSDEAQENQIMLAMSENEDSDDPPTPTEQHRTKSPPVVMEISVPKAPLPKIPISRMPNTRRSSPKVTMSRKATQMRTTNALNGFQTSIVAQNPQISAMSNSGGGQYALAFPGTTATPILVDCNGFVLQNLTWDGQCQFQAAPSNQQNHHQPQQQQPPVQYFQSINSAVSQGGLQFASQPQSYFSFGNQIYSTSVPFPQDSLSNGPQGILEIPHEGFTIPVQDNQIKFEIIDTPTLEQTTARPVLKENPVDIAMKEIMDIHVVSVEDNEIQEISKEPPSVHTLSTNEHVVVEDAEDNDDDEVMILEMPSSHMPRQEPITRSIKSEPITFREKDVEGDEVMSSKTSGSEPPVFQMNSFQDDPRKEPIKEKSGLSPPKLTIEGNSVQHQLESFSSKVKELRNGFASSPYPSSSSSTSSSSSSLASSYSFSSGRRVEEKKEHGPAQSGTSLATHKNKDPVDPSPKKQEYKCERCSRIYKYLEFLKVHQKRCSA